MNVEDQLNPPPAPRGVGSFVDLTAALRELFAWAGRPKYATLSAASGLAPSAISNLIGKRPLRRPSEAATLRFVEACLGHAGYSPRASADQVEEWRATWRRLDALADQAGEAPADPDEVTTAAGPGTVPGDPEVAPPVERRSPGTRRHRRNVVLGVIATVLLVVAVGVGVRIGSDLGKDDAKPAAGSSGTSGGGASCKRTTIPEAQDVRNQRTWRSVFRCPNDRGAQVLLQPAPGSPVVSTLTDSDNWFVCWTRGKQHAGGNAIWYYTQGDTAGTNPKVHSWGYVAANEMGTATDPDPQAFRECPAR